MREFIYTVVMMGIVIYVVTRYLGYGRERPSSSRSMPRSMPSFEKNLKVDLPKRENNCTKIMPMMKLVMNTEMGPKDFPLSFAQQPILIGSSEKADLRITKNMSEYVSRKHAYIICDEEGQYWLEDADSQNGIYELRDGQEPVRVEQIALKPNISFYIADVLFETQIVNPFTEREMKIGKKGGFAHQNMTKVRD